MRRIDARGASLASDSDLIAAEEPLLLEIEHGPEAARVRTNLGVLLRTPGRDEDLAAGLLFAEGFVTGPADIVRFEHPAAGQLVAALSAGVPIEDRLARRVLLRTSACGMCGREAIDDLLGIGAARAEAGPEVTASVLRALPAALLSRQAIFNDTGGLHAAALFDSRGALLAVAEDVGRHNALDKLVGAELMASRLPLTGRILVVSGRAAFEIVHKAVMAGAPVLAAVGAPSSLAVDTARAFGLTLVGFLRDDRFNIYSGFERIV